MSENPPAPAQKLSHLFVSVVLVLRNNADVAAARVAEILQKLHATYENYELVVVDDGSDDATLLCLQPLLTQHIGLRILELSRHFGTEVAVTAGLENAIGDVVLTMTPFDPPDRMADFVAEVQKTGGIVNGVAEHDDKRRHPLRQWGSALYHSASRRFLGIDIVQDATTFRALSRSALNAVVRIREKHRYLQVFAPYIGLSIGYLPYRPLNVRGKTQLMPILQALNQAIDVVVTSSLRPLRAVTWLALAGSALNVLYVGYVALIALFKAHVAEGWITQSLQNSGMFLMLFLILAVSSEYLGRLLTESRDRPLYFVRQESTSSVLVPIAHRRNVTTESRHDALPNQEDFVR